MKSGHSASCSSRNARRVAATSKSHPLAMSKVLTVHPFSVKVSASKASPL